MKFAMQRIFRVNSLVRLPKLHESPRYMCVTSDTQKILVPEMTLITESVIKNKLQSLSVPFTDGYTCFHVKDCSLCSCKKSVSSTSDIFINKKTGFFVCEQCKAAGNWYTFSELVNKSKSNSNTKAVLDDCVRYNKKLVNWEEVVQNTSLLYDFSDEKYQNILEKFQLVSLPKKMIENLYIRINEENNILYFPLFCSGNDLVGYKTYELDQKSNTVPRIDCPGFLLSRKKKKSAVVVASIPDFFSLLSQNLPQQILCLPYGVNSLPQTSLPFLENYDKIILWLGPEGGGLDSTRNFAKKLDDKRCYVVRPTENQTSPTTALLQGENIKRVLEEAKPTWHESIISFSSLREEVLAELQNKDLVAGVPWKRFPELNKILKGHRRGELTVLTGPTGAGKTTFISEYSLDLALQGVNTLWGSFEIKNSRLVLMMLRQFNGGPLSDNLNEFNSLADKFEQLPIFFMTFHGQQNISTVMEAVEHCSYIYDIAHVIIDNVQFMIEVSPDSFQIDRFWKQDCLIQSFRSFASKNNCHVTLVMHPKKGMDGVDLSVNSIFGGAKAAQEADNILIIQNKRLSAVGTRKFLQVSKNRYSGDLGAIPLNFDKESLCFSKTTNEKGKGNPTKDTTTDQQY